MCVCMQDIFRNCYYEYKCLFKHYISYLPFSFDLASGSLNFYNVYKFLKFLGCSVYVKILYKLVGFLKNN